MKAADVVSSAGMTIIRLTPGNLAPWFITPSPGETARCQPTTLGTQCDTPGIWLTT